MIVLSTDFWPPFASAEALTAWATAVLVLVTGFGLWFTRTAVQAAVDQLKLEANPLIVISELSEKPARIDEECAIVSPPRGMGDVAPFRLTFFGTFDPERRRIESPTLPGFKRFAMIENVGRSPAVSLSIPVKLRHLRTNAEQNDIVPIASLAAGEKRFVAIENTSEYANVTLFFNKAGTVADLNTPGKHRTVTVASSPFSIQNPNKLSDPAGFPW